MGLPGTFTSQELSAHLQVSHTWLLEQARMHPETWPSLRVGRNVRFTQEHVTQIVGHLERKPSDQVAAAVRQEQVGWGRPRLAVLREQRRAARA